MTPRGRWSVSTTGSPTAGIGSETTKRPVGDKSRVQPVLRASVRPPDCTRSFFLFRTGDRCFTALRELFLPDRESDLDRLGHLVVVRVHLHHHLVRVVDLALVESRRAVVLTEGLSVLAAGNRDRVPALVVLVAVTVR